MGYEREAVEKGFEQDRADYWAMRHELLAKYPAKWVAVHKGRVIAVADEPLSIMEQALAEEGYAYTNKVGDEDKIVIRQRRVSFPYDDSYSPTNVKNQSFQIPVYGASGLLSQLRPSNFSIRSVLRSTPSRQRTLIMYFVGSALGR
jgi:hypothetical protein